MDNPLKQSLLGWDLRLSEVREDVRNNEGVTLAGNAFTFGGNERKLQRANDKTQKIFTTIEKMLNALQAKYGDAFCLAEFLDKPALKDELEKVHDYDELSFRALSGMVDCMSARVAKEYVLSIARSTRMRLIDELEIELESKGENDMSDEEFQELFGELKEVVHFYVKEHGQGYGLPDNQSEELDDWDHPASMLAMNLRGKLWSVVMREVE